MNYNNPYSDLKIFRHYDSIKNLLEGKRVAPIYIRIKPTNVCNQRCYYCCYADDQAVANRSVDRRDFIPKEKMSEIINDIKSIGVKAVTFSGGGDPLCYPYIEDTLDKILDNNIDLSIITNGQLLNEGRAERLRDAKWVRISLDSADADTYYKIRGVKTFDSVISNIEKFALKKRNNCELGINFVISQSNYKQIYNICRIGSAIGVNNIKFSGMMIQDDTQNYHQELVEAVEEQMTKAKQDFQKADFRIIDKYLENLTFERCYNKCLIKYFVTVIAADQKVYTCHQKAYTPSGKIGSIKNRSFKDLWFSDEVTKMMEEFNPKCECKAACVYDQRNILLNTLYELDDNHINFI